MPVPSLTVPAFVTLLVTLTWYILDFRRRKSKLPYPPGPPPNFILGNAFDIPKRDIGHVFAQWTREWKSGIVHAEAFGRHLLVLNDRTVAEDLIEKRPEVYSDRPTWATIELLGWQNVSGLLPYGELWRLHRRILRRNLEGSGAIQSRSMIIDETHAFLRSLLSGSGIGEKGWLDEHIRMFAMSVTLLMMYGYKPDSLDDPIVRVASENERRGFELLSFGSNLVNLFPFLRYIPPWVPGASTQKEAAELRSMKAYVMDMADEYAKKALAEGTATPSLLTDFYLHKEANGATLEEEQAVKDATWTIYGAAAGTVVSILGSFIWLMVKHPDAQRKAQAELDRVVGQDCLPDYEDRKSLPYVEAIYREVLRYRPPVHTSVYRVREEDTYKGYCLPAGSTVLGNIWAMTHDEKYYADPDCFLPERFLTDEGELNDDSRVLAYGFGRRLCAGKAIASDIVWLVMASLLISFDMRPRSSASGDDIGVDDKYEEHGPIVHKAPFQCSIAARSEYAKTLIDRTAN